MRMFSRYSLLAASVIFRTARAMTVAPSQNRVGVDYPALVVFDLDACLCKFPFPYQNRDSHYSVEVCWLTCCFGFFIGDQEMYEMSAIPSETAKGDLNGKKAKGILVSSFIGLPTNCSLMSTQDVERESLVLTQDVIKFPCIRVQW